MSKVSVLVGAMVVAAVAGAVRADAVAHWDFDRMLGDKYLDRVNNAHPATPQDKQAVKSYTGKAPFGGAVTLDGTPNSYLTIPALKAIQKSSFTVAAWVNLNTPGPNFILSDWPSMGEAGFVFGTDPLKDKSRAEPIADLASKELPTSGNNRTSRISVARLAVTNKTVPLNDWHHLAWTWNREAGVLTAYLDGVSIGSQRRQGTRGLSKGLDLAPNDREMRIGAREWIYPAGAAPAVFNGSIDELWVFDTALTADQLNNLIKFNNIEGTPVVAVVRNDPPATPTANNNTASVTPAPEQSRTIPETPTSTVPVHTPDVAPTVLPPRNPIQEVTPAAVAPKSSAGKTAGVIACLIWAISLSSYLAWGLKERAKLKAMGKL
ncbi:MAG TPA: LamG-like jellyroll fold domain-containing protein [Phycisphaerae bacterium]|jgi:hypothetical protein|nr:LamG-like jellyroll fold domain-containing protein [Phycisphaerae bacterium]